jgi:hypothetical protein
MAPPNSVRIYVPSHRQDLLHAIPDDPRLHRVDLGSLHRGTRYASNLYGEGRLFLADPALLPITGFANARFDDKYTHLRTRLADLPGLAEALAPDTVLAPWTARGWLAHTYEAHPTMDALLEELLAFSGLPAHDDRLTLWANDLIAHESVVRAWLSFWRRCFLHFDGRYGALLPMGLEGMDPARTPAYLYERVTALYFASRDDLKIVQMS